MADRKQTWDPKTTPRQRSEFKLIADVLKETESSLLVRKVNAYNQFWIDKNNWSGQVEEGKRYCFVITISTYPVQDDDNCIRTKLRLNDCYEWEGEVQGNAPTFIGIKSGSIEDFVVTDINNLKLVTFKTDLGETLYIRYFSDKDPQLGDCTIDLDLRSTSAIINTGGTVWSDTRMYTDKEGNQKETKRWFPSLEITDIK